MFHTCLAMHLSTRVKGLAGFSPTSGNSAQAQGKAGREALRAIVGSGEYFLATLPDGSRLVQPIPRGVRHPLNFGREARPSRCHGKLGYMRLPPSRQAHSVSGFIMCQAQASRIQRRLHQRC